MSGSKNKDSVDTFITLEAFSEFRFEVEHKNEIVELQLTSGTAEIFGSALVISTVYKFRTGAKIAVFTWEGCVLNLVGKETSAAYVADETPMAIYANIHLCFERLRQQAEQNDTCEPPVVMIVGPSDVGKSTLCKILLNYATRLIKNGRKPIFVDVDASGGHISVPGTIGALVTEQPDSIDEGFTDTHPLVYNYGHLDINENPVVYDMLVSKLAENVIKRMQNNRRIKTSGVIINTYGWSKDKGNEHLIHIAQAFKVNHILVLDQEKLYKQLMKELRSSSIQVTKVPKSGGVVEKNQNARHELREALIRVYFYGTPKDSLCPHTFDMKFSEVKIVKIGVPLLPDSCLPVGFKAEDCFTKVTTVQPGPNLLHHLLAMTHAASIDTVIESNVSGFICVTNVDVDKQTLQILSPQKKPTLQNTYFVLSEVQYFDSL